MPDTFRDTLAAHLEQLEREISATRAALAAYDRKTTAETSDSGEGGPYAGVRPYDAVVAILEAKGGRMDREELMAALIRGGATHGKKRGIHNLRISIDTNVQLGKLRIDGSDVVLVDGVTMGSDAEPEPSKG